MGPAVVAADAVLWYHCCMSSVADTIRTLGIAVRRRRIAAGLTQERLADLANVSRSTVHHLENGHGSSLESFVRVLRALDATDWVDDLADVDDAFDPFEVLERAPRPERQRVRTR